MHTCNCKQCACHKRAETFFTAMGIFRFSVKLLQIPMSKKGLLLNRIPGATRSKLFDTVWTCCVVRDEVSPAAAL